MKKNTLMLWLLCFSMGLFFIPGQTMGQPLKLTFAHFVPPQHAQAQVIEAWSKKIEELSAGKVAIEVSHSSKMAAPTKLFELMKSGLVDMIYVPHAYVPGNRFPLTTFFNLPFMVENAEKGSMFLWQVYNTFLQEEHNDIKVLWLFSNPPGQINTKGKLVKTIEDMKGLKFGTTGSWIVDETVKRLGAQGLTISVNEMAKAAKIGVIDGVVLPFEVLPPFKAHEQMKNHAIVNLYVEPMLVAMNKKKYESLPSNIKRIIDDNIGEQMCLTAGRAFDETEKFMRNICIEQGATIYDVPADELDRWKAATQPVYDLWVKKMSEKGLPGKELLEAAKEILAQTN